MSTQGKAQFTPGPTCTCEIVMRTGETLDSSLGDRPCSDISRIVLCPLHTAAPAMYEALTDAERMWNIARMIDSKHHAGNPISNDLWSDFHRYLMEWHAKRKAALAQAEGRQA